MELSVVCTARNDNYEGDFVGRFIQSVETNCKNLLEAGLNYEYINVEWLPNTPLSQLDRTKHLFSTYNLHDYLIDQSVVNAENLHPTKFLEYYSKNTGIRRAKGDNILITNPDIVLPLEICKEIKRLITVGLGNHFYRARFRRQTDNGQVVEEKDLYEPHLPDGHLMAGYSGDFTLVTREVAVNIMQGYDEVNQHHRNGFQTMMDGESLFQMHKKGVTLKSIDLPYNHLYHGKTRAYDSSQYNQNGYENKPNWGFVDYPTKQLDEKTTLIYAKEN